MAGQMFCFEMLNWCFVCNSCRTYRTGPHQTSIYYYYYAWSLLVGCACIYCTWQPFIVLLITAITIMCISIYTCIIQIIYIQHPRAWSWNEVFGCLEIKMFIGSFAKCVFLKQPRWDPRWNRNPLNFVKATNIVYHLNHLSAKHTSDHFQPLHFSLHTKLIKCEFACNSKLKFLQLDYQHET